MKAFGIFSFLFVCAALTFAFRQDEPAQYISLEQPAADSCSDRLYHDTLSITYFTSFGMCFGYCFRQWTFTPHCLDIRKTSHRPDSSTVITREHFAAQKWDSLTAVLDIPGLLSMKNIYGCPDCADGGAEGVTLNQNGKIKTITFDYGRAPAEILTLVTRLRAYAKK